MSGLVSERSKEEVKERADILEVASGFTEMKREGRAFKGLCPFHDEKTPSFSVNPEKGTFKCFGCGERGDAIDLLVMRGGMEFVDAVEHLADRAGVVLEYEGGSDVDGRARAEAREARAEALRANALAAEHYRETLLKGADAKARAASEYLTGERGLSPETLDTYRIGYAHPGQGFCAVAKNAHGVGEEALDAAGLANERGRDFFARRITFPIRDARGRVVGFGGRAVPGDETWVDGDGETRERRKYLNSSDSDSFTKRRLLYGLDAAMGAIRKTGSAVVVEGYTDVLALHQAGIKNAVATLGTEMTPEHVETLARHAKRVTLVFDSDEAGQKAVERAKEAAARKLDLRVLLFGEKNMDPAKWLLEHSGEEFESLLDAAPNVVEWEMNRAVASARGADAMERQRALEGVQDLIASLEGDVLRHHWTKEAASAFGLPVKTMLSGVASRGKGSGAGGSAGGTPPRSKKGGGDGGDDKKPPSPADKLLGYVRSEEHELFVDQVGAPHILWRGRPIPLNSVFDRKLRVLAVEREGSSMGKDAIRQARDTLAAFAYASDVEHELHTRAAWHEDALYYQLGKGRILKVDASGYRLVEDAPVLFRHVSNLQPLPDPEPGGDFDVLANFINLKNTRDKRLFISWMVVALLPHVARPIMEATGEMGAGKTVMGRMAKRLLDPSRPETVQLDKREFLQKASHAYIVMLDNLQSIPEWAVDTLCRLVTGEADSKRVLYENDEDFVYELKRALIVNGINTPTDRGDARDRTLPIELERIKNHRPEEEMWREFAAAHPKLLGCVFEALSKALAVKPNVRLTRHARLADWSVYAASVYEGQGWGSAKFEEDWQRVVRVQNQGTLEGSGVAQAVVAFMESRQLWRGTSTDLHIKLETFAEEMSIDVRHDPRWPKSSNWVWKRIKEVRPLLTALGIDTRRGHDARGTMISLERIATNNDPENDPPGGGKGSDAEDGSSAGSKNALLPSLLPSTSSADTAENGSSGSNGSISGHLMDPVSRSHEEEGEKTPENGGVEGYGEGETPPTRQVPQNASITSNASKEGSEEENPRYGRSEEGASAGGSEAAAADEENLTPRERAERRRARLAAERDETGTA